MAKAKTGGRGGSRGTSKSAGTRRGVGKGDLEVGNARRDAGAAAGPMRRTATKRPTKSGLQLPGEKAVPATGRTVPVEPRRRGGADREPLPAAAVDRRRQVIGTDDRPRRGRT